MNEIESALSPASRRIFLVSAPSGTGKTTIIRRILEAFPNLRKIVTTTSRPPRAGEVPGLDYHFVSRNQFVDMCRRGEFIEWKEHFAQFYGLSWAEFNRGPIQDAIFDMDVLGKEEFVSRVKSNCITIFLAPPSIDAIEERIRTRGNYSEEELRERTGRALEEMERADTYDFVVVNAHVEQTVEQIKEIIGNSRAPRLGPRYICVEGLIGAGKTTLTQVLGASLGAKLYLDPFESNPFLQDFYYSRRSFALETELSFALLRYRSIQRIRQDLKANRLILSDFTMWRSKVFASVTLDTAAYGLFDGVYRVLEQELPIPHLLIWIDAPHDLLLKRIKTRGRAEEIVGVEETYLRDLEQRYQEVIHARPGLEILHVTAESLDLLRGNEALRSLVAKIAAE